MKAARELRTRCNMTTIQANPSLVPASSYQPPPISNRMTMMIRRVVVSILPTLHAADIGPVRRRAAVDYCAVLLVSAIETKSRPASELRSVVLAGVDHEASSNATDSKIAIRRKIGSFFIRKKELQRDITPD